MAGLIDGEGTFSIDKHKASRHGLWGRLRIVSTNKSLLDNLKKIIGRGSVFPSRKHIDEPQKKVLWEYYLGVKRGLPELLSEINGCLFLKKEHAEVLMRFFSSNDLEEKQTLYLELKSLNGRGR